MVCRATRHVFVEHMLCRLLVASAAALRQVGQLRVSAKRITTTLSASCRVLLVIGLRYVPTRSEPAHTLKALPSLFLAWRKVHSQDGRLVTCAPSPPSRCSLFLLLCYRYSYFHMLSSVMSNQLIEI